MLARDAFAAVALVSKVQVATEAQCVTDRNITHDTRTLDIVQHERHRLYRHSRVRTTRMETAVRMHSRLSDDDAGGWHHLSL